MLAWSIVGFLVGFIIGAPIGIFLAIYLHARAIVAAKEQQK